VVQELIERTKWKFDESDEEFLLAFKFEIENVKIDANLSDDEDNEHSIDNKGHSNNSGKEDSMTCRDYLRIFLEKFSLRQNAANNLAMTGDATAENRVTLSTIHQAKVVSVLVLFLRDGYLQGLQWTAVFVVVVSKNVLPHNKPRNEDGHRHSLSQQGNLHTPRFRLTAHTVWFRSGRR
jgi:superfamily I DNA/RNA helicase